MNKEKQKPVKDTDTLKDYDLSWIIQHPKFGGFMDSNVEANPERPGFPLDANTVLIREDYKSGIEKILDTVERIFPYQAYFTGNRQSPVLVFRFGSVDSYSHSHSPPFFNLVEDFT